MSADEKPVPSYAAFIDMVDAMRAQQREFFRRHDMAALSAAKAHEATVDDVVKRVKAIRKERAKSGPTLFQGQT